MISGELRHGAKCATYGGRNFVIVADVQRQSVILSAARREESPSLLEEGDSSALCASG